MFLNLSIDLKILGKTTQNCLIEVLKDVAWVVGIVEIEKDEFLS